jgi:hypothetical protein
LRRSKENILKAEKQKRKSVEKKGWRNEEMEEGERRKGATHVKRTSCYKSVHKLSTSCVRTACS